MEPRGVDSDAPRLMRELRAWLKEHPGIQPGSPLWWVRERMISDWLRAAGDARQAEAYLMLSLAQVVAAFASICASASVQGPEQSGRRERLARELVGVDLVEVSPATSALVALARLMAARPAEQEDEVVIELVESAEPFPQDKLGRSQLLLGDRVVRGIAHAAGAAASERDRRLFAQFAAQVSETLHTETA